MSSAQHTLTARFKGTRKSQTTKAASTPVKYCSERCRHKKPSEALGSVDRRISDAFIALLDGKTLSPDQTVDGITSAEPPPPKPIKGNAKKIKGETRITVSCAEVEKLVFGARHDSEKVFGRKKNRARRGVPDGKEWKSVDMEDKGDGSDAPAVDPSSSSESGSEQSASQPSDTINLRVRPPQSQSEVNGSIGGEKGWAEKIEESPEMMRKRLEGQKRADERELVRCAARRLCAFGIVLDGLAGEREEIGKGKGGKGKSKGKEKAKVGVAENGDGDGGRGQERRKRCEAVMNGNVVEASYAKGEWGIQWRE